MRIRAARTWPVDTEQSPDHTSAEIGVLADHQRRPGVMRLHAAMFRREAKREGNVELSERLHLPIQQGVRVGPETIRPTQPGPVARAKDRPYIANPNGGDRY